MIVTCLTRIFIQNYRRKFQRAEMYAGLPESFPRSFLKKSRDWEGEKSDSTHTAGRIFSDRPSSAAFESPRPVSRRDADGKVRAVGPSRGQRGISMGITSGRTIKPAWKAQSRRGARTEEIDARARAFGALRPWRRCYSNFTRVTSHRRLRLMYRSKDRSTDRPSSRYAPCFRRRRNRLNERSSGTKRGREIEFFLSSVSSLSLSLFSPSFPITCSFFPLARTSLFYDAQDGGDKGRSTGRVIIRRLLDGWSFVALLLRARESELQERNNTRRTLVSRSDRERGAGESSRPLCKLLVEREFDTRPMCDVKHCLFALSFIARADRGGRNSFA